MPPIGPTERDLRLDLFRGLALWLIFLDHIPSNIVNWLTIRNYGFSDAAEIFVFISGYTAAFVYGRAMHERGFIVAGARIYKRVWQVYVAHVFIFVIFMAEIAYLTASLDNPLYSEEMRAFDFLQQPGVALIQALLLKFQPNFMDVLPLYIVLLLALPFMLWLLLRRPLVVLALSVTLYAAVQYFSLNLPAYPTGTWFFNPLAWQLIFVAGAWCAVGGSEQVSKLVQLAHRSRDRDRLSGADAVRRDDLVFPALCLSHPQARAGLALSDRQEQPRFRALPALQRAGDSHRPLHPDRLAGA